MTKIRVSAPGKLHLLGEHTVVHNRPAIIAAVDKRCFVEISLRKDDKIVVRSENFKKEETTSFAKINKIFQKAQKDWEEYDKTNNIPLLKSITKNPLDYPLIAIGQFFDYFKLKAIPGFNLMINSEIPVGRGMGSSAAVPVSITAALLLFTHKKLDKQIINKISHLCEQKKHGKPSGGDTAASCFGGLIWFKKDTGLKPLKQKLSKNISNNFYMIDTGAPIETTGEMVSRVKDLLAKNPKSTEAIFDGQTKLVHELLPALQNGDEAQIIKIIQKGEANLETLGVVSGYVQKIIRAIEQSGGAAKINGGGGIKKGTGVLLIYHKSETKLNEILLNLGLKSSKIALGAEGVRRE